MNKENRNFDLKSLLLVAAAVPMWIYLSIEMAGSKGFGGSQWRFLVAPIALTGIACAIYWLLRQKPYSISISIFVAPLIAMSALLLASFIS